MSETTDVYLVEKLRDKATEVYEGKAVFVTQWVPPLLDKAADKIAALREENTTLRKALKHSNIWVKSALACKSWVWSGDQREAAESSVNEAKAVLKETGK